MNSEKREDECESTGASKLREDEDEVGLSCGHLTGLKP